MSGCGIVNTPALNAAVAPLCSLGLYGQRPSGPVVGRLRELTAVRRSMVAARSSMACILLEGEPGIGKTRFLLDVDEIAAAEGFLSVAVTADEEIRGPFLLARSIFASPPLQQEAVADPRIAQAVADAVDALSRGIDPSLAGLSPDQRLLRAFDLASVALRALTVQRPLALLMDDLQWADEDSLRLLRYFVRTNAAARVFLVFALRPNETAEVNEAITLLADVERMGVLQRVRLERFSQIDSATFLAQLLGGPVDPSSAAIMHAQAEGLPFMLSEQARAYRDAGLVQPVDGRWTLARNAERLLPSAVRTLIQRRAARLPEASRVVLSEAAVLGRHFSLRDLADVETHLGEPRREVDVLEELLEPAVQIGLIERHTANSPADYSFTHDGVREYVAGTLSPPRRRALHGAVVDLLMAGGEPAAASLSMLAGHALAAGRSDLCVRVAIDASRQALEANAPEEVLRLIALAQPVAAGAQLRVELLRLRDDALLALRRPAQRLEVLTELSALAEAMGDTSLEFEIMLRRASALRLSGEDDVAADVASRVCERARALDRPEIELDACLELAQALLRQEIGDSSAVNTTESDIDGAEAAYRRALELARALGDERKEAAALREIGMVLTSRVRAWFIEAVKAGEHLPVMRALLSGTSVDEIVPTLPIAPQVREAAEAYTQSLAIYERLGDRRGIMTAVIGMAVLTWAPGIHLTGSVQHIEEIRRLTGRAKSFTRESERAQADAQMVFGAHVYARMRGFADQALVKGQEAHRAARALGDPLLEFAAIGGMILQHAELGDREQANQWIARAAALASSAPTPLRSLQLELWRGIAAAELDQIDEFSERFRSALLIAAEQGKPAARSDALSWFASYAVRLGERLHADALIDAARQAVSELEVTAAGLPGHAPWIPRGLAVRASLARIDGNLDAALGYARSALAQLRSAVREELSLDVLLPAAQVIMAHAPEEERREVLDHLQLTGSLVAQRIEDEAVRVRWFARPMAGRLLVELAGEITRVVAAGHAGINLDDEERALLRQVTEARSNSEIAAALGQDEEEVARGLAALFAKIGAAGRADATAMALTGSLV